MSIKSHEDFIFHVYLFFCDLLYIYVSSILWKDSVKKFFNHIKRILFYITKDLENAEWSCPNDAKIYPHTNSKEAPELWACA